MKRAHISDKQVVKRAQVAVSIELEKKRAMGMPIVALDRKSKAIYQVNNDGTTVAVQRIRKGRYSERIGKKA